jgi:sucrose phosphorylase
MRNGCQLITYPDSIGGNLKRLEQFISAELGEALVGVHILPFFPSSADRGFAPLSYYDVDPRFGSWNDISRLSEGRELIFDFMVNHISRQSAYVRDFISLKDRSEYRDMFIRYKDFWPGGEPAPEDLEKIYTRKPRPPYTEFRFADGTREKVWCTFDEEQIDLNLSSPVTRDLVARWIGSLSERGASVIRLDAFAYTTKKPGTNCFFVEPDVWEVLEWIAELAEPLGVELLPEIHEHYSIQLKLAERGYRVYDFALPMLVLQALFDATAKNLVSWLRTCPRKQITTLDTHDGIGVVDARGLMSDEELDRTRENLFSQGANVKKRYNTPSYNNLDIYQINCTYYSALGESDDAYLLARAIQFFAPGIPQVYYVGLLAGRNDIDLVESTKVGRNINRHYYTEEELSEELHRPVVRRLLRLMRFRSTHASFDGELTIEESEDRSLVLSWANGEASSRLEADLATKSFEISYTSDGRFLRLEV